MEEEKGRRRGAHKPQPYVLGSDARPWQEAHLEHHIMGRGLQGHPVQPPARVQIIASQTTATPSAWRHLCGEAAPLSESDLPLLKLFR